LTNHEVSGKSTDGSDDYQSGAFISFFSWINKIRSTYHCVAQRVSCLPNDSFACFQKRFSGNLSLSPMIRGHKNALTPDNGEQGTHHFLPGWNFSRRTQKDEANRSPYH
jgi:hypothetical protein